MKMKLDRLVDLVSKKTSVDLREQRRTNDQIFARAIYYDIAYNKLKLGSLKRVGDAVGRHHASVIYSLKNITPDLKRYHPQMYLNYMSVLEDFSLDQNDDVKTPQEIIEELVLKYDDLKQKYDSISSTNKDAEELIMSIRQLPEDKMYKLKIRVEAIMKMI